MKKLINLLIDGIYPNKCLVCKAFIDIVHPINNRFIQSDTLCLNCRPNSFDYISNSFHNQQCITCGEFNDSESEQCFFCTHSANLIKCIYSVFHYTEKVKRIIYLHKKRANFILSEYFAFELIKLLKLIQIEIDKNSTIIVTPPASQKRSILNPISHFDACGYITSQQLGIPFYKSLIQSSKHIKQGKLSLAQRISNKKNTKLHQLS